MQSNKVKPMLKLVTINREFVRTAAVASTAVKSDANLKAWKDIPGPSALPFIGQLHHFIPGGSLHKTTEIERTMKLYETYGPIVRFERTLGVPAMILLFDPDSVAQIIRGEDAMPVRPGFKSLEHYRHVVKRKKGYTFKATGLVTDHGDTWREVRSMVNPIMLRPKTIKLYNTVLDEVAQDMVKRMKADRDDRNMLRGRFDLEMNLWALESIGTIALGCRLNCLNSKLADDSPEKQLIECIHDLFTIVNKLDFQPNIWRYYPTPLYKKAIKLYEHHETLTKYFLNKGVEAIKTGGSKSDNEKGILEKLLEINEEVAYIMASDMLFAGVDTAANTITATLYLLAKNPEKQEKLRQELLANSDRRPYLRACIKESLRVMPVVSGNIRMTTKEYDILGYKIPENMNVVFAHRDMSLMEDHFPRAKEYIPERWLVDKNDQLYYGNAHPFAHGTFGFGIRSCIGRRIAELELETFLARLIENFRVEWFGAPPHSEQTSLIYIKGPFNFIFKDV